MERISYKMLVAVCVVAIVMLGWEGVEGGRKITKKKIVVDEPENYSGSYSGTLPGPITGTFQTPGYTIDFPSPGLATGTLPSPGSCFPGVVCTPPAAPVTQLATPVKPVASLAASTASP